MINLKRFTELEAKGAAEVVKAGNSYAVSYKKFDPETGEARPNEVYGVDLDGLLAERDRLEFQIAEIDSFIAKAKSLV